MKDYEREAQERADEARGKLIALLTEKGWAALRVDYNGGGDSGEISGCYVSKKAYDDGAVHDIDVGWVPEEGTDWQSVDEGPGDKFEQVDGVWQKIEGLRTPLQEWGVSIHDLSWPIVSRKWGGFAFEGSVTGMVVLDVASREVYRRDEVALTEYESETETF